MADARAHGGNLRADTGWAPIDLTFRGDRWSNVELTTVTEEHGGGRRLTRVRSRLRATPSFYAVLAATSYLLLFVWLWEPGWELGMVAPVLGVAWTVTASSRRLRRVALASVLAAAEALGMTVVGAPGTLRRAAPAATPAVSPATQP